MLVSEVTAMPRTFWLILVMFGLTIFKTERIIKEWNQNRTIEPFSVGSLVSAFLGFLWGLAAYVKTGD